MCRLGIPFRIHTDQGRKFESALFTELCSLLEIIKSRTTRQITLNLTVCWRGSDLSFLCRMDSQYYGDENLQSSFKRQKRYHDVCDRWSWMEMVPTKSKPKIRIGLDRTLQGYSKVLGYYIWDEAWCNEQNGCSTCGSPKVTTWQWNVRESIWFWQWSK